MIASQHNINIKTQTLQRNPYIVGSAISDSHCFFGREKVFQFVEDNLNKGEKAILLHGQRRIGKSSVLLQIPNFIASDKFVFIPFDLQNKGQLRLSNVLHLLAEVIVDNLKLDLDDEKLPSEADLATAPSSFSQNFLPEIYRLLGEKNLVLMLDEFDTLNSEDPISSVQTFFPYLQSLLSQHEKLFIIPVIGRKPDDLPKLLSLFRRAPTQKIGLLSRSDTEKLIIEPAKESLVYDPDSIEAIFQLSKGHPYFTQLLCYAVFVQARTEGNKQITAENVEGVVDEAIEIGEGGLAWFRDGLPIPERVIFAAVAEAQKRADLKGDRVLEKPLTILKEYGVVLTESLIQAEKQLVDWDFLDFAKDSENDYRYEVKVELVRRWLVKQHPLKREIWQLEQLEPAAQRIYQSAIDLQGYKLFKNAIALYEEALSINPNHFNVLFKLAEIYLEMGARSKALELYKRAYKVDSYRTKEGYIQSLRSERVAEIKVQIRKIKSEFRHNFRYISPRLLRFLIDFYLSSKSRKSRKTSFDPKLLSLASLVYELIVEASNKLPESQFQNLCHCTKLAIKNTSIFAKNNNFSDAEETMKEVIDRIYENLAEEKLKNQLSTLENQSIIQHDNSITITPISINVRNNGTLDTANTIEKISKSIKIFISYYDAQILQEIKTVFSTLGEIAPEIDSLELIERKQSNNLETVTPRMDDIRSCSSAIIYLPSETSSDDSIKNLAYLDLGASLALLNERRTLIIYEGNQLPDNLVGKVETFQYQGSLDFQKGMELARKILKVLQKDS